MVKISEPCRRLRVVAVAVATAAVLVIVQAIPCPAVAAGAATSPLEGRWKLVEQHYAGGAANLASAETPVRLEVSIASEGIGAVISAGEALPQAHPWPAFVNDEGPLPVTVLERLLDSKTGTVRARYEVRPSEGDDLVLLVEESYRLSDDGKSLAGAMTVRFRQGSEDRGSYTLQRRFEREP